MSQTALVREVSRGNAGVLDGPTGVIDDATLNEVKPVKGNPFLKAFFKSPLQLGTCFSSSPGLARAMCQQLDLASAGTVLELGSGTGPLTVECAKRLRPGARLIAVEMNHDLAQALRARLPAVRVVEADAIRLIDLCRAEDMPPGSVDAVCASLPYMLFPGDVQSRALDEVHAVLRPGGRMVMLTYWPEEIHPRARRWRRLMDARFRKVKRAAFVWTNVPPAFVYLVEK